MRCRKAEDTEWQARKEAILNLYVTKNMSLREVIKMMAAQGFSRSYVRSNLYELVLMKSHRKPQYERILKTWAISKNIHSTEWQFIFGRLRERDAQVKRSIVKVRGIKISTTRLNKEKPRQGYLRTYEQHALREYRQLPI